ncbi:MAG: tetratricopeptide repeat protein [Anaerolineae bacterium]|nr:tetratricopeptide repeat protein [Anaerolineae bacterium]MDW8172468.1 tetratricopeptide repeat protein [Anaerolineae bacterium]
MSANVEAMIRAGIDAFRAGNKADARALLERAIELDEYNEMAWLWLAAVVETPEEQRTCLENVLVINPNSERARQGLKSLGVDPDAQRSAPSAATSTNPSTPALSYDSADDLFGDADFSAPTGPDATSAKGAAGQDYDSWVGGLGLGKKSSTSQTDPFTASTSPFSEFDFGQSAEDIFKDDELFDSSVRSVSSQTPDSSYSSYDSSKSLFIDTDDELISTGKANVFETLASASSEEDFSDLLDLGDSGSDAQAQAQNDNIFAKIPAEIAAANRLPGMDESAPRGGMIVLGLLGIVNVVALLFFISALLT